MAYEARCLDQLIETRDALNDRTWRPSRTIAFVVDKPKAREIHAADFKDRVVHHWLAPRLQAWFEPVFIHDSYANRKGRGAHAAVDRLQDFVRQATRNGKVKAYFLQLDIANYFNSIDRNVLYGLLRCRAEKVWKKHKRLLSDISAAQNSELPNGLHTEINFCLWLCRTILEQDTASLAVERGSASAFARVPEHKRLKNAPAGKGLPIGNLTSQFFANVYLDQLDQFVKHQLKCRHYLRYVDDFVLVHENAAQLLIWRDAIVHFLAERLGLRLKALSEPKVTGTGIDFLGYVIRRTYRLPRRRVLQQAEARMNVFAATLISRRSDGWVVNWKPGLLANFRASMSSTLGHLQHAASHRIAQALWEKHSWARSAFDLDVAHFRLVNRYEPASVASYRGQIRWFARRYKNCVLLVQKGWKYELIDREGSLKVKPETLFAEAQLARLISALRRAGRTYVIVREAGYLKLGLKRRVLSEIGWTKS